MSVDLAQHEHAQRLFVDQQVEESLTNAYRSRSRDTLVEFEGVDRLLARIDVAHQRIGQATKGKWWALWARQLTNDTHVTSTTSPTHLAELRLLHKKVVGDVQNIGGGCWSNIN